jgi:hypothetical protein
MPIIASECPGTGWEADLQTVGQSRTRQVSTGYRRIRLRHCHKTKASISPHTIRAGIHPRSRTMKNAMITSRTAGAVRASQSCGVIFRMERNLATWCECPQAGHFQSAFGRPISLQMAGMGGKQSLAFGGLTGAFSWTHQPAENVTSDRPDARP